MLVRASTQDFAGTHRIMDIGCVDLNMQQIAHYVDNHMALTTFHFFAAIDTAFFAVVLGFDALRIEDAVAGTGGSAAFFFRCRLFK